MATTLKDFYVGTTKNFTIRLKLRGTYPDIRSDTVTLMLKVYKKDDDTNAKLKKDADVTTSGVDGIAKFSISKTDTAITPMEYFCDIQWQTDDGEEYVPVDQKIKAKDRVSDV